VLLLLAGGLRELLAHRCVARDERLRRVERLRADLARVVDAHEPRCVALLFAGQLRIRYRRAGGRSARRRDARQRAQTAVETHD